MPLPVADQTHWRATPRSLRWARQHSGALIGNCRCRPSPATGRRGRQPGGSQHGPGWFYCAGPDITSERKEDLEHPPQRHVRKKLVSRPMGQPPSH